MSNETRYLNDIKKSTKERPDEFLALAGNGELGSKPLAGLKIGSYYESQYRAPDIKHNYIDVMPDLGIDSTYYSFYYSNNEANQRATSFSEAARKYNEVILEKDPKEAEEYLIHNIPAQSTELIETYIKGQGYGAKPESCIILNSHESATNPENSIVILYKDGNFAVVDDVKKDRFGLDLRSMDRPKFDIKDMQEALNDYASKSKCEVEYSMTSQDSKTSDFVKSLRYDVSESVQSQDVVKKPQRTTEREI